MQDNTDTAVGISPPVDVTLPERVIDRAADRLGADNRAAAEDILLDYVNLDLSLVDEAGEDAIEAVLRRAESD